MFFHIDARNKEHTEAYASPVSSMRLTGEHDHYYQVYYEDLNGFGYYGSADDFIRDPIIIREVSPGHIYKIKLEE